MEKLNQILIEVLKVSGEDLGKDLSMSEVRHWDSLSHMNLIVEIEKEFNIELTGDEIAEMTTFGSIRNVLQKYV
jgi:acyl carrier protein